MSRKFIVTNSSSNDWFFTRKEMKLIIILILIIWHGKFQVGEMVWMIKHSANIHRNREFYIVEPRLISLMTICRSSGSYCLLKTITSVKGKFPLTESENQSLNDYLQINYILPNEIPYNNTILDMRLTT